MTEAEFIAEAKRRTQRATPSLTDAQWSQWLVEVAQRRGRVVLTLDGCLAAYDLKDAQATPPRVSNQQSQ